MSSSRPASGNLGWRTKLAGMAFVAPILFADSALAQRNRRDRNPDQDLPAESVAPEGVPKPGELRGSIVIEFTITVEGTVKDIVVVESTHPGVFDEPAINAVRRWRYEPKIENGSPSSDGA